MKLAEQQIQEIIMEETKLALQERSRFLRGLYNFMGIMRKSRAFFQFRSLKGTNNALDAAIKSAETGRLTQAARTIEDAVEDGILEAQYAKVFRDLINESAAQAARGMDSVDGIVEHVVVFNEIIGAAKTLDSMDDAGVVALLRRAKEVTDNLKRSRSVPANQARQAAAEVAPEAPELAGGPGR